MLDDGKLKNFLIDLKILSDVEDNEVAKNARLKTLETKVIKITLGKKKKSWCNYINLHESIQHR